MSTVEIWLPHTIAGADRRGPGAEQAEIPFGVVCDAAAALMDSELVHLNELAPRGV
jgi:hypothetical protein